jgi:hypothetical protein
VRDKGHLLQLARNVPEMVMLKKAKLKEPRDGIKEKDL